MAFWGVEVKPGKPYTHQYGSEHGRLHVSQATLGSGSSTKKSIVQCNVGDKKPIYLCSLLPERLETCQLNLEFEEDDEVTFSVIGPHSVHLSGFFYGENEDNLEDDYPLDSDEVDISETESESDDSMDYDSEDEDEDDFIDDDLDMYPPSHVPNSGVKIEEIVDEEKPASENDKSKRHKKMKSQLNKSDESKISGGLIIVKAGGSHPVLESEDEDGFPISSPHKTEALQRSEDKKDGRASEKVPKKKTGNDSEHHKNLKRKIVAVSEDGEHARKTGQQSDSLLQSDDAVPENDAKQKKKNKKKKVVREEEIAPDTKSDMDQVKAAEMENGQKPIDEKEKEKKKKKNKKKNKKQESTSDSKAEQSVTAKKGSTETETKPSQVRSFPNGLVVEELAMGKPDGKRASNGKKVSVRYIGKLKNNGKIFDSNIGRAPFKFRLGVGQVIKGWDVGVNGMRVGDKRRLTIPPSMGYGKKGAGGAIPPNAWLVFDVELVDVN